MFRVCTITIISIKGVFIMIIREFDPPIISGLRLAYTRDEHAHILLPYGRSIRRKIQHKKSGDYIQYSNELIKIIYYE